MRTIWKSAITVVATSSLITGCGGADVAAPGGGQVPEPAPAAPAFRGDVTSAAVLDAYPAFRAARAGSPAEIAEAGAIIAEAERMRTPGREPLGEPTGTLDLGTYGRLGYELVSLDTHFCLISRVAESRRLGGIDCGHWAALAPDATPFGVGGANDRGGAELLLLVSDAVGSVALVRRDGAPVPATINGNVAYLEIDEPAVAIRTTLRDGTVEDTPVSPAAT